MFECSNKTAQTINLLSNHGLYKVEETVAPRMHNFRGFRRRRWSGRIPIV